MRAYTLDDAERELPAAMDAGDWDAATVLAADVDRLDQSIPQPPPSLLGSALWYCEVGLRVFPLQPGAKDPMPGSHGCKDAVTDPATITAWWGRWPSANIGIATGHLVDVLDFDGPEAHAHWGATYGQRWGGLTILGKVSTPRPGGLHVYVPATGVGNRAGVKNGTKVLPHVDYRGRGGYVVAPPSSRRDGTYRWLGRLELTA